MSVFYLLSLEVDWQSANPSDPAVSIPNSARVTVMNTATPGFYGGAGDSNSGPHACAESSLTAKDT